LIGKKVLFCLKKDDIQNSLPENAYEADILDVRGPYVQMNAYLNDGSIVTEWKWVPFLKIIEVLDEARHTRPFQFKPATIMQESREAKPEIVIPKLGEGPLPDHVENESPILLLAQLHERVDMMRNELTAVRHHLGTWMKDSEDPVDQDLYLESIEHLFLSWTKETKRLEQRFEKLIEEQAKDIGMIKKIMTSKGLIA